MSESFAIESDHLAEFEAALQPRLQGDLRLDSLHRWLYATDASMYRIPPVGVLVPRTVDDVQAAIEEARTFEIPVLPRGAGTSLAGSAVGAALLVDTRKHLRDVVAVDPVARTATVQPGVVLDDLNRIVARRGLMVGPDPASSNRCTLGGMVGTNATGTHSIVYGSMVDHVEKLKAILPDGTPVSFEALDEFAWLEKAKRDSTEGRLYRHIDALLKLHGPAILQDTPRHWRRAGGYRLERLLEAPSIDRGPGKSWDGTRNLSHLLCGSEGTLAFTTEITLNLVDKPEHTALGIVHFESRRHALEHITPILETKPSAVELLDAVVLNRAREVSGYASKLHFVDGNPAAVLIVEYAGQTRKEVENGLGRLRAQVDSRLSMTEAKDALAIADVWAVRKVGLGLAMSAKLPIQALAVVEDAAVPVQHLPDYIDRLVDVMDSLGVESVVYAHASAGCLHVRPFLDTRRERNVQFLARIAEASAELVKEYGGLIASEHGDGLARSPFNESFYGKALYDAYRSVKQAFDPENRFNPGKITDAPPVTENLRYLPGYEGKKIETKLTFPSANGRDLGFSGMAEACNGMAVCRKERIGTMCPPFMATLEEKDTTRGRANALREALSGELESLTGDEVAEAMDLCISCKACRAECPAGVDMAALKTVWLEQKWKSQKPPKRARLFADLPKMARRFSGWMSPVVNRVSETRFARKRLAAIGISADRTLPPFTRHPFVREDAKAEIGNPTSTVVLYADTFARFHDPAIPRAAISVMEAIGSDVVVPPYRCCGRTYLSGGFVDEAHRLAQKIVETYAQFAEAELPIVGLEPSCILTLRDELPRLLPDDPRARAIARHVVTFEEWAARYAGRLHEVIGDANDREVLVHGHCHQKALSSMDPTWAVLEAAGFSVRFTEAGCCGMAGSFGYETEHFEVSKAIAEDRLLPAIREVSDETILVAAGTSCRHQISDLAGRRAVHPVEVLATRAV
ncbi:MAG: FAD-binding and (Fe-S)-binding domain-containing protein [Rubricoccaceae bacterium]|nr:FAD-binding and (Fe-S)-binding domain-containing protein [Rubricoccaceae bacterium]